jgi:DNA-binding Xre family transcriptional regulator
MSQTEVANAIGVKKQTIPNWVHGKYFKKLETDVLERLCDYFNCEIGDVLYLEPVDDMPDKS